MTTLPASGYWENNARTEGEGKQWGEDIRDVLAELLGGSAASMLTIASGVIVPTIGIHTIETEAGAASDYLTNITTTNTPDGRLLLLSAYHTDHTVVVRDAAGGAGQIHMLNNADVSLIATLKWILLIRSGADWYEIISSDPALNNSIKIDGRGILLGDYTGGRILRTIRLKIDNAAAANEIKCTVTDVWNGDTIAETDNIGKNETVGDFKLDIAGAAVTIRSSGLTGNCVAVISASVDYNAGGSDMKIRGYMLVNDIVLSCTHPTAATIVDLTGTVDVGVTYITIAYITDA